MFNMVIPAQSSWMIRKILRARDYLTTMVDGTLWLQQEKFSIHKLYKVFVGEYNRKPWAKLICQNIAPPSINLLLGCCSMRGLLHVATLAELGYRLIKGVVCVEGRWRL